MGYQPVLSRLGNWPGSTSYPSMPGRLWAQTLYLLDGYIEASGASSDHDFSMSLIVSSSGWAKRVTFWGFPLSCQFLTFCDHQQEPSCRLSPERSVADGNASSGSFTCAI